jgi:hypothetical protein
MRMFSAAVNSKAKNALLHDGQLEARIDLPKVTSHIRLAIVRQKVVLACHSDLWATVMWRI